MLISTGSTSCATSTCSTSATGKHVVWSRMAYSQRPVAVAADSAWLSVSLLLPQSDFAKCFAPHVNSKEATWSECKVKVFVALFRSTSNRRRSTLTMLANSNQWPAAVPSLAGRLASSPLMLFTVLSISKDHEAEVYSNSNARSRVGCILRSDPSFLVMAPLVEALHMATCHFSPMTLQWLSETAQGP